MLSGKDDFYYKETVRKTCVVVHSTHGVLTGDIAALTTPNKVSVHFVIARDGTIYQLFDTANWAYHLGASASGGNGAYSKRSVSIELSNIGPLVLRGDTMYDIYGVPYCASADTGAYIASKFRSYDYYATYTNNQQANLAWLVKTVAAQNGFALTPPAAPLTYANSAPTATLFFHQNVRLDKVDPGPALDYSRLSR